MPEQPGVIRPPDIFYENGAHHGNQADQTINAQHNITYLTTRIEASPRGILLYQQGKNGVPLKYPCKGWPTPEAMWNCNIVKQVVMGLLFSLSSPSGALMLLGFLLTPWRWKIKWLNNALLRLGRVPEWTLHTSYFKEEIWSTSAQEMKKAVYLFLFNLGIDPEAARIWAKAFAFLIETDNAYRYRMQDIMSEASKEALLKTPRQEITRLVKIYEQRDSSEGMKNKFRVYGRILNLALLIPKIRRAWIKTVQEVDVVKLQLDEEDHYHVLARDGYNFLGRKFEDRYKEWVTIHNGNPPDAILYTLNN